MNINIPNKSRLEKLIDSTINSLNAVKSESNAQLKAIELRAVQSKITIIIEQLEELVVEEIKTDKNF